MANMFQGCDSLSLVDLSNFDTSSVTIMSNMFLGCTSLSSNNLSNFDTIIDMSKMFYGCDSLAYVDLSNFNMINCNSYSEFFSNINNIKYINLYNFQNDKIIGNIFKESVNSLFVCQSNEIIKNENSFNCCNYNFENNECNSELNANPNEPDTSDSSNGNSNSYSSYSSKSNKSSGISKGVIIGIIIGGIVIIGGIIAIIIYCIKKNKICHPPENSSTNVTVKQHLNTKTEINQLIPDEEVEYEPNAKSDSQKIGVIFATTFQKNIKIIIDPNKSIHDLIKFYFDYIKLPELFCDPSINFVKNANMIEANSKNSIKKYMKKMDEIFIILVNDTDDKIHNALKK
jgi:surface protein